MSTGGDDVVARYSLDPSGFERGVDAVIAATRRIEAEERRVAKATEQFEAESSRRRAAIAEARLNNMMGDVRRHEQRERDSARRLEQATADSERRKAQIAADFARQRERAVAASAARAHREELAIAKQVAIGSGSFADYQPGAGAGGLGAGIGGGIGSMLGGLGQVGLAIGPLAAVVGAMQQMDTAALRAYEHLRGQADELFRLKELARGLATMTGQKGATEEFTAGLMDFRAANGLSNEAATDFLTEIESTGGSGVGTTISQETFDKSKELLGRLVKSQGGGQEAAGAYAGLAGIMMRTRKYGSADEIGAELLDVIGVLGKGRGTDAQMVKEMATTYGGLVDQGGGNLIQDPRELATYVAAASLKDPREASTVLQQMTRLVIGNTKDSQAFNAEAGIEKGMTLSERMEKYFAHLEKAQVGGELVSEYMIGKGLDAEGSQGMQVLFQQREFIRKAMGAGGVGARHMDPGDVEGLLAERFEADQGLQQDRAVAAKEREEVKRAAPMLAARTLEEEALARLVARDEIDTAKSNKEDWRTGMLEGAFLPTSAEGPSEAGRRNRIGREMQAILAERGEELLTPKERNRRRFMRGDLGFLAEDGVTPTDTEYYRSEEFQRKASEAYEKTGGFQGEGTGATAEQTEKLVVEAQSQTGLLSLLVGLVGGGGQASAPLPPRPAGRLR